MQKTKDFKFGEFYLLYPRLTALVGSRLGNRDNIMPASWHTPLSSEPPLYGVVISPQRASFEGIRRTRGFSVNFVALSHAELSEKTGFSSGRDTNKFQAFGIETVEDTGFGPVLKAAYAAMECRLVQDMEVGDHHLFVGQVEALYWDEDATVIYQGHKLLSPAIKPLLYAGRGVYAGWDPDSLVRLRE